MLFCFFFSVLVLGQSGIDVEPKEATVQNGQNVTLLCRSGKQLDYCRFEIPNLVAFRISDKTNSDSYSYYGSGLESGDCGVHLYRVDLKNNGKVRCILGFKENASEGSGTIDLVVGSKDLIIFLKERNLTFILILFS